MRVATVCALAISMSLAAGVAFAQNDPAQALAVAAAPVATQATCPGNPNPLGVARVVEIDTTGGPGFGFEHFKSLRLPARAGSGADLRRRSVARQYASRTQGTGSPMH